MITHTSGENALIGDTGHVGHKRVKGHKLNEDNQAPRMSGRAIC